MTISRLDLDGLGSPAAIAGRILELEADLPLIIPLEDLCSRLDIGSIEKIDTQVVQLAGEAHWGGPFNPELRHHSCPIDFFQAFSVVLRRWSRRARV